VGVPVTLVTLGLAAAWLALLVPWYRRAEQWKPARHQRGMYLALGAWAVTDVAVLVSWAA